MKVFIRVNVYNYFHHVFFASLAEDTQIVFVSKSHSTFLNHLFYTRFWWCLFGCYYIYKEMNYHILQFTVISYISFFNINSNICAYNYLLKTEIRFYERLLKPSASTCHKKLSCAKWYIFSMSCINIAFLKVCIRSSSLKDVKREGW